MDINKIGYLTGMMLAVGVYVLIHTYFISPNIISVLFKEEVRQTVSIFTLVIPSLAGIIGCILTMPKSEEEGSRPPKKENEEVV